MKDEEVLRLEHEETIARQEKELKLLREKAKTTDELADDLKKLKDRRSKVNN